MHTPRRRRFEWQTTLDDTYTDHLLELHRRVLRGDPAAIGEIWVELWRLLWPSFQRREADPELVNDAVNDAICVYLAKPQAFSPSGGSLDGFVYGIARHKLQDRRRARGRDVERESAWAIDRQAYESDVDRAVLAVQVQEIRSALPRVCDEPELAAIEVYLERGDEGAMAGCLGVSDLPPADQWRTARGLLRAVIKRLRRFFAGKPRRG